MPETPNEAASEPLSRAEQLSLAASHGGELRGVRAVSWSGMSTYQDCGKRYELSKIKGIKGEIGGAMLAGSAVHRLIELMTVEGWFRDPDEVRVRSRLLFPKYLDQELKDAGSKRTTDAYGLPDWQGVRWGGNKRALRDDFDKTVKDPATGKTIMVGENYPWMLSQGPLWVQRAAWVLRTKESQGWHIVEENVEKSVAAMIPGAEEKLLATGIIDIMVVVTDDGEPVIVDWKSGRYVNPLQLAQYAWILANSEALHLEVTKGEIAYLRATKNEEIIRPYDLAAWIPLVPQMMLDARAGIEAGYFPMRPSAFCVACGVKEACDYGKTLPRAS